MSNEHDGPQDRRDDDGRSDEDLGSDGVPGAGPAPASRGDAPKGGGLGVPTEPGETTLDDRGDADAG